MLCPFKSLTEAYSLLKFFYKDPIAYVEELATFEGSPAGHDFQGWYSSKNLEEYLMIRQNWDQTKSIFFNPIEENWSNLPLKGLVKGKTYVQTNLRGEEILGKLKTTILFPHTVVYFRWGEKLMDDIVLTAKPPFNLQIKEKMQEERLIELEVLAIADGQTVGSSGSNLINRQTAMVGIWVSPSWRKHGLGRYILTRICKELLLRNITPIYACDKLNIPSFRLASRFFVPYKEFRCLFVGNWALERPSTANSSLPNSLFVK